MSKNKLALTEEEKARDLNAEEIKGLLINKAILETAKEYKFSDEEEEEFEYFFNNEKNKFFIRAWTIQYPAALRRGC